MKNTLLFAVDTQAEETIVSESQKGSNKVNLLERISRKENDILYHAVMTLTCVTKAPDIDMSLFKAMDKVCQLIYQKHLEKK